jgi:hypothetical protein
MSPLDIFLIVSGIVLAIFWTVEFIADWKEQEAKRYEQDVKQAIRIANRK